MAAAIGIDLGTTNSAIAVIDGGKPQVVVNAEGARTTPSVVAYKGDERLVGQVARRQAALNPRATFTSVKRFIGRTFDEAREDAAMSSAELAKGPGGSARFRLGERLLSPEEVTSVLLRKLAADASQA